MAKQIELVEGSIKGAVKAAKGGSGDLWKVPPSALRIIPGFNPRVDGPKRKLRVAHIKELIRENGYLVEYPMTGFAAREGDETVLYVTGGHTRHSAVTELVAEGFPLEYVSLVIPKGRSMADLALAHVSGNDGEPLTVYEQAVSCKQAMGYGLDSAQIAKRLGYASAQYVDGLIALASAPLAIRQNVINEVTSATTAIDMLKKHGDKAVEVLTKAVMASAAKGGRVTAKNLPGAQHKKLLRKAAEPMYEAVTLLTCDPAFNKLSQEVKEKIGEALKIVKGK